VYRSATAGILHTGDQEPQCAPSGPWPARRPMITTAAWCRRWPNSATVDHTFPAMRGASALNTTQYSSNRDAASILIRLRRAWHRSLIPHWQIVLLCYCNFSSASAFNLSALAYHQPTQPAAHRLPSRTGSPQRGLASPKLSYPSSESSKKPNVSVGIKLAQQLMTVQCNEQGNDVQASILYVVWPPGGRVAFDVRS
jgi:hypothetical protein